MEREINSFSEKNKVFYQRLETFKEYIFSEINGIRELLDDLSKNLTEELTESQKNNLEKLCDSTNVKLTYIENEIDNMVKGVNELESKKTYTNGMNAFKGPVLVAKTNYDNSLKEYIGDLNSSIAQLRKNVIELKNSNKKLMAIARSDVTIDVVRNEVSRRTESTANIENWVKMLHDQTTADIIKLRTEIGDLTNKVNELKTCEETIKMLVDNSNKLKQVLEICLEDNNECQRQLELYRKQVYEDLNVFRMNSENKMNYLENLANSKVVTKYV